MNVIDTTRIKAGRLIKVWNTDRAKLSNAKPWYISVWVEDADGKNERCLLFTPKELEAAEYRASRNIEDLTKKGFATDLFD